MWTSIQNLLVIAQTEGERGAGPPGGAAPTSTEGAANVVGNQPDLFSSLSQTLFMFLPFILIFYFLLIRPESKRRKQHEARINRLKKGDRVVTSGGILGTIVGTKENIAVVKIADNVKVEVQKASITTILDPEGPVEAPQSTR